MPETAQKASANGEQSPVAQAKSQLQAALRHLEKAVQTRVKEASEAAGTQSGEGSEDAEQWKNACAMLEEQSTALKEENSRLHDELHQAGAQSNELQKAVSKVTKTLDDTIAQVEKLLEG